MATWVDAFIERAASGVSYLIVFETDKQYSVYPAAADRRPSQESR